MVEWHDELQHALERGDAAEMKAALARVPGNVLHMAAPLFARMAQDCVRRDDVEAALTYLNQLIEIEPEQLRWRLERAQLNRKRDEGALVAEDAAVCVRLEPANATAWRLLAEAHDGLRNRREALDAYRTLQALEPDDAALAERIAYLDAQLKKEQLLQNVLDPAAAAETRAAAPPLPSIRFDPQLLRDASMPAAANPAMLAGLKQHLLRYSVQHASRNALERLDDSAWLEAWDAALAATKGQRVLLHGSELGAFALRARAHGAAHVTVVEPSPLDARIAAGVIQKNLIASWHACHGSDVQQWSEDERRASFEQFARGIEVLPLAAEELQPASYDVLIFPNLDQTLLGTGVVSTIAAYRARGATTLRVLPGKARLFAQGVQWEYPGTGFDLAPLNRMRWSPYPQAHDLPADCWRALTPPVALGEIDLAAFEPALWTHQLPVAASGRLDAVLFWFELDLGAAHLGTEPGSTLRCLKPALQYADQQALEAGATLGLRVHVEATRLYLETVPPPHELRAGVLPSWYLPMLVDAARNDAYRAALAQRLAERGDAAVLDIGAGCGLLSMMAAASGAPSVTACEIDAALAQVARDVAAAHPAGARIRVVNKDCRQLAVPEDMPAKADLAVFELFDCSLIGEGVLHYLAHAREHLLAPNAIYVPLAGRVRAMLVEYRLDRIWDLDVNILNPYRFAPEFINVDARRLAYKPLSAPFDVFAFAFADAAPLPAEREIDLAASADGVAGAVLFWFDLELTPGRWLSNAPDAAPALHWKQGLQFLPEVEVRAATSLPLSARHNGSALSFRWRKDALPSEAFSKLPRFDPRVFEQTSELQAQTANLFQHCLADPAEFERVAAIAQRLAVDPAAHGIDPRIAQRFAAKFFLNGG